MNKKSRKKILVVDDDNDILDVMKLILNVHGYDVKVSRANEVDLMIKNNHPDLIFMDVLLSGNDGREISKKLKSDNETKDIPIILISALPDAEKSAQQIGIDFLAKPFELKDLLSKVSRYC